MAGQSESAQGPNGTGRDAVSVAWWVGVEEWTRVGQNR